MEKNNLPTFRILYLVSGILSFVFSFIPLIYVGIGLFFGEIYNEYPRTSRDAMPFNPGMFFVVFGLIFFVIIITMGILNLLVAKYIKETRNYNFVFAMAIVNCLGGILGILLGVFTLIEIHKPYAKELFGVNKPNGTAL